MTTVTEPPSMGGGVETLVYDGDGRRVQKVLPGGTTNYIFDAFGRLAAEYSNSQIYSPCTTCYLSYDHLGSVRMVMDASANVIARHDYLPFGEEIPPNAAGRNSQWGPGADNVSPKFTGQIRDEETGLDYFNARYFGAALGRFLSPDPGNAGANPSNPQTWNAYAYVVDNPLANTDPTGMDVNYAGFAQGVCPASMANCPTPGQPVVGRPSIPNEIDAAETRYVQEIVVPGFSGIAPPHVTSAPLGEAVSATITYGTTDLLKQISASTVSTSDIDTFAIADLRVTIYAGANGYNHAGIGVNSSRTYGLYPATKPLCLITNCTVPGRVKEDKETPISTVLIKTTPSQDALAQNAINRAIQSPPNYNLYHENCALFVESVLRAAGVKNVPNTILPNVLGKSLGCKR